MAKLIQIRNLLGELRYIILDGVGMLMIVLQKTQTIVRYQNHSGKVYYGIVEDGEILQLSSNFTEIVKQ